MPLRLRSARRLTVVLIALSSSCAVVAAFCLPAAAMADPYDCGAGAVIIVGGTNDPDAVHMVGVKQRYSGTGIDDTLGTEDDSSHAGAPYRVIYADYPTTLWPLGAAGYDESVAQGNAATKQAIARYQSKCDKPIVVAGYSQGARVAGDVLSDIGNDRDDTVVLLDEHRNPVLDGDGVPVTVDISADNISGELYADPRRVGDKTGRGIELSLIGVIPGLTMTGARDGDGARGFGELEDSVRSICVDGDPICDLPDPLYDPIGTIDGLVGYFTKHGLYPWQMYRDPTEPVWNTGREVDCGISNTDCMVAAESAIAGALRDGIENIGLDATRMPDFLAGRWTVDLPYGIELSNLQPVVRLIQDVVPPLPYLGYGGYLPDLFVFEDILEGIVRLAPDQFRSGVTALAASVKSIVLIPANFVRYWVGEFVGPVSTTTSVPTRTVAGADEGESSAAFLRVSTSQTTASPTTAPSASPPAAVSTDGPPSSSAPAAASTNPSSPPIVEAPEPSAHADSEATDTDAGNTGSGSTEADGGGGESDTGTYPETPATVAGSGSSTSAATPDAATDDAAAEEE